MQLYETNDKFYNLSVNSVLSYDSVLLARLIINGLKKAGYLIKYDKAWNNPLSSKHGKDGSYALKNWMSSNSNRGVDFSIKDDADDDWDKGSIKIYIDSGYAHIVIMHYDYEGYKRYKIGTNISVKDFTQKLIEKYESLKKQEPSEENTSGAGGLPQALTKLLKQNGFKAEWTKDNKLIVFSNEFREMLDEQTIKFLAAYSDNSFVNFSFLETITKFKKYARYFAKRMASEKWAFQPLYSSIHSMSNSAISIAFQKTEAEKDIQIGLENLESMLDLKPRYDSFDEFGQKVFVPIIKKLFEDEDKRYKIIEALKHIY